MLLGAEVPRSRRDGQEGIDSQAESIHTQPNVSETKFDVRRPAPLRGVMFTASSFTDWPVSHKHTLRHIVVDETASCVSPRTMAVHIFNRLVGHTVVSERS